MLWLNFFHLYQPANSDPYHITEAADKSYARLTRALEENYKLKFTFNISGCLLDRLEEVDYHSLIERWVKLYNRGQMEIVGTAFYHPLLPLIPLAEAEKQIIENENILKKYFGETFRAKGFFLPEMAYSPEVAKLIKARGYEWLILDEIAYNGKIGVVDCSKVYEDKNSGLKIIFRSRKFSNCYLPDQKKLALKEQIIVSATDGELYGLRHEDPTGELESFLKEESLETMTISEYIKHKEAVLIEPLSCNWESSEAELIDNKPFALWRDRDNKIHQNLWLLANLAEEQVNKYQADDNYHWARWHLVRGLASCTFWWASGKDFSHNFGPQAWAPDEIERGVNELVRAIRSLHDITTRKVKIEAEKLALEIKKMVWEEHWENYWQK